MSNTYSFLSLQMFFIDLIKISAIVSAALILVSAFPWFVVLLTRFCLRIQNHTVCFWQYNFIWLIIITRSSIITRTYRRSFHIWAHDDKLNLRWRVPALICSSFLSYKRKTTNRWVSAVSTATESYHPHPLHLADIFSTACFMSEHFMIFKQLLFLNSHWREKEMNMIAQRCDNCTKFLLKFLFPRI